MEIEITKKETVIVKYLQASCEVRYWEDGDVNGVEDTEGNLIPCRKGDMWKVLIELDTGKIVNWPEGTEASVHYKVCDAGVYKLLDAHQNVVVEKDGYVPDIMHPKSNGYGDYVIMDIDKSGIIQNWKIDLTDLLETD